MRLRWPTKGEERLLEIRGRAKRWKASGLVGEEGAAAIAALVPGWKSSGIFARGAFFLLGLLCVGALFGIQEVAHFKADGWVTAAVAIGLAELFIDHYGFLRTGIEEALYIGGLYAIIFGFHGPPRNEGLILFAIATLIAGLRLANAFFAAGSVAFMIGYVATEWSTTTAAWVAIAVAVAAATASAVRFERPFVDRTFDWLTMLASVATIALYYDVEPSIVLAGAVVALVVLATIGLASRAHPPLVSSMLLGGFAVTEACRNGAWPLRNQLLLWGIAIGLFALVAERILRERKAGLTSRKLLDDPESGLLQIAGTIAITPARATPPQPSGGFKPGGGGFGGGGASGEY